MNLQPQYREKRFALRISLRLPIVVSGCADDCEAWVEPTETDDISTNGALLHLNQKVTEGQILYIRSLQSDGVPVEVKAKVIRISRALYGSAQIGIAITGLTGNWLNLFAAWISDDQPEDEKG